MFTTFITNPYIISNSLRPQEIYLSLGILTNHQNQFDNVDNFNKMKFPTNIVFVNRISEI